MILAFFAVVLGHVIVSNCRFNLEKAGFSLAAQAEADLGIDARTSEFSEFRKAISPPLIATHDWLGRLKAGVQFLNALILRQQWSLFTEISPFNYTTHFEVVRKDGSTVALLDSVPQKATGWEGVLFHSEDKVRNNLYGSQAANRRYLEYLIRQNGIDPTEVSERVIFIRYHNVLSRSKAAVAGTRYGPELRHDLHRY